MVRRSGELSSRYGGNGRGGRTVILASHASLTMRQLVVWDVFLIDQDFKIERPTRYYRQGLNLFHQLDDHDSDREDDDKSHQQDKTKAGAPPPPRKRLGSTVGSIKSSFSKVLHLGHNHGAHQRNSASANNLTVGAHNGGRRSSVTSGTSGVSGPSFHPLTPMLDPSTNTNPLEGVHGDDHVGEDDLHPPTEDPGAQRKSSKDVSKHTFYVVNAQTRLKLYAKNERQMLQWIAAFERVAKESHYTGKNRFDSFAPIRLNVAAQWLVDGVSILCSQRDRTVVHFESLARLLLEFVESYPARTGNYPDP